MSNQNTIRAPKSWADAGKGYRDALLVRFGRDGSPGVCVARPDGAGGVVWDAWDMRSHRLGEGPPRLLAVSVQQDEAFRAAADLEATRTTFVLEGGWNHTPGGILAKEPTWK